MTDSEGNVGRSAWRVRLAGRNDEWRIIYATLAEKAAEQFSEIAAYGWYGSVNYEGDFFVEVRPDGDERIPVRYYAVHVEVKPTASRLYVTPPTKNDIEDKAQEMYSAKYPNGNWELADQEIWRRKVWKYFLSGAIDGRTS
jgi:hypothetical protein